MENWIKRWQTGQTGWHKNQTNTRLIEFMDCLELRAGDCVFVPLCGKSKDMIYLLARGFKVIGVELSALAIVQFFTQNQLTYSVQRGAKFDIYRAPNICIYCGDYFALSAQDLKSVKGVYDRASLIALPSALRIKYSAHLYAIIPKGCKVLLLTLSYAQEKMNGPPYSVNEAEVKSLFERGFNCLKLQCFNDIEREPKFKNAGMMAIDKATYCLHKNGGENGQENTGQD